MKRPNFLDAPTRHTRSQRGGQSDIDAACALEVHMERTHFWGRVLDAAIVLVLFVSIGILSAAVVG
jgi:hypothetical protein